MPVQTRAEDLRAEDLRAGDLYASVALEEPQ